MKKRGTYTASQVRRWLVSVQAYALAARWIAKAAFDNWRAKECVLCHDIITDDRCTSAGAEGAEVMLCLTCSLKAIYARIDKFVEGRGDQVELEQARDGLRTLLAADQSIKPKDIPPSNRINWPRGITGAQSPP